MKYWKAGLNKTLNIQWNAEDYTSNFNFVYGYGEGVTELLTVPQGAFVIDLGCGNGTLTKKLAEKGYRVMGVDASADMIAAAGRNFPELSFLRADALTFDLEEKADAIFSNAVFHWIDAEKQQQLLEHTVSQLKPGGELVFEFGGKGCAETVHAELERVFQEHGLVYPRVFYFPSIGEYAPLMENAGLQINYAVLFDRPTEQKNENGLEEWIRMFVKKPFEGLEKTLSDEIILETVQRLRPHLLVNGKWYVDYVRIRMRAVKMDKVSKAVSGIL